MHAGVLLAPLLTMQCASPLSVERGGKGQKAGSGEVASSDSAEHPEGDMSPESLAKRNEMCARLFSAASAFGLENCWQWKPLMDGKQVGGGILAALEVLKTGAVTSKLVWVVMRTWGDQSFGAGVQGFG